MLGLSRQEILKFHANKKNKFDNKNNNENDEDDDDDGDSSDDDKELDICKNNKNKE